MNEMYSSVFIRVIRGRYSRWGKVVVSRRSTRQRGEVRWAGPPGALSERGNDVWDDLVSDDDVGIVQGLRDRPGRDHGHPVDGRHHRGSLATGPRTEAVAHGDSAPDPEYPALHDPGDDPVRHLRRL